MNNNEQNKIVLTIGAHPDDSEFFCTGTLALLRQKGWQVHSATMTPGDCGSAQYNREEISKIRKAEAAKSASLLEGQYHCLECDDVFIMYDRPTLLKTIELIRKVRPTLVFTLSSEDYMVDHTTTGTLVQTACFSCGIPNIQIPGVDTFDTVPYLFYMDTVEGKDTLGRPVTPSMVVDISSVIDTKKEMLACHESQRNWLLEHHGIDEYLESMKRWNVKTGKLVGANYGEGFRQHLGHAFPHDNILKAELGDLVHLL